MDKKVQKALFGFAQALQTTGAGDNISDLEWEVQSAPHIRPCKLQDNKVAIYGFFDGNTWLKIGKAGPRSGPRYCYHHYHPKSSRSTTAASLLADPYYASKIASENEVPEWMMNNLGRLDIRVPLARGQRFLSFLEAYLQFYLQPRFEGQIWAK